MQWAYIAGFFDGEGHIGFAAGKSNKEHIVYRVVMAWSNNHCGVLEQIRSRVGMGHIHTKPSPNEHHRTSYTLFVNGMRILPILHEMLPYLVVKRPQVELMIEYIVRRNELGTRSYTEEDWSYFRKMRELNDRVPHKGRELTLIPHQDYYSARKRK